MTPVLDQMLDLIECLALDHALRHLLGVGEEAAGLLVLDRSLPVQALAPALGLLHELLPPGIRGP